jgi:hypothetical protein
MPIWKVIQQSEGGVAVVIPSLAVLPGALAPAGARPRHVTITLSDYGVAGHGPDALAHALILVDSGGRADAFRYQSESRPIAIGDDLLISVEIAAQGGTESIRMVASLRVADVLPGAWHLAIFPGGLPAEVSALSVMDGRLQLSGARIHQHDYALLRFVEIDPPERRAGHASGASLQWHDAQGIAGVVELTSSEIRIGRAMDCAIRTDDAGVSRHHARVFWGGGGYVIEDLSSANGVYFEERRVQSHMLKHGDAVRCGTLWLRFVDEDRSYPSTLAPMMPHPGLYQAPAPGDARGVERSFEMPSSTAPHGGVLARVRGWFSRSSIPMPVPMPMAAAPLPLSWPAAVPAATPVHWNTRILDGERALDELFVIIGRAYVIETGLDPAARADALASSTIAPRGLPDGTKVTFELSCPQPILRMHGDAAGAPAARVSHTETYDAATGCCPPARFGLVPAARGRIPLTLNVVTGNAIRASTRLTLQAEPAAAEPAEPAPPISASTPSPARAPRPIDVAAALAGPPAQLRFELTSTNQLALSDGVVNEPPRRPSAEWSVLITEAINARRELVALSGAYRRDPARASALALADAPAMCLRMAKIGARLHRAFFGTPRDRHTDEDTRRLARAIADTPEPGAAARLQIAAAFQPFPWAVLYDGAYRGRPLTDDPASVDLSCFWGGRFAIDRMILGHAGAARAPTLRAPVRVQACLNPHLDDEPAARALGVRVVGPQRALFDGMAGVALHPRIESGADFMAFLRSGRPCDLLYVFCHATAAVTRDALFTYSDQAPDTQAKLIFDRPPAAPVDVRAMQEAREEPLADRPLVVLNACASAAGDEVFQSPMLEQFLERWGAVGVLGTDWEVPTVFADAFARRLFAYFLNGRASIGAALRLASREAFAEGNPFPLVYALYARPDLVTTEPPLPPAGPNHE